MARVEAPGEQDDVPAAPARPIVALAKQTLVYGLSSVVLQLVGVVTLPIFARTFTPSEYGVLELGMVASWIAIAVADVGLASASQRSYFDYRDDQRDARRTVLYTAFVVTIAVATGIAVATALARDDLSQWLFGGDGYSDVVVLVALLVPATIAANFLREALRLHFRAWSYVLSACLGAVVGGSVAIVAVVVFDSGVEGVFLGLLVGNGVAVVYGLVAAAGYFRGSFSRPELRTMLAFGLPLVPTAIAMWALSFGDRILLAKLADLDDVGQYAVASRVSSVLLLGIVGFQLALSPYLFSIYARDPETEKAVRGHVLTYAAVALTFAGLALTLFAPEVIAIAAPDYDDAYEAVGLLVLGVVAFGIASVLMAGISLARRTSFFAAVSLVAAGLNVALNIALIPAAGMLGAAAASATTWSLLAVTYYVLGQRVYRTPYEPWKPIAAVTVAAAFATLVALPLSTFAALAVKLAALVAFVIVLRLVGVLTRKDFTDAGVLAREAYARVRRRPAETLTAEGGPL